MGMHTQHSTSKLHLYKICKTMENAIKNIKTKLITFHDGAVLRRMYASEITAIPIWKGNRILDTAHVEKLKRDIGENIQSLDSDMFRVILIDESDAGGNLISMRYIVDGQHRLKVLQDYFAEHPTASDFHILCTEKRVSSEMEIIDYFNKLNNSKPIQYTDYNLVVNMYIYEFEKEFNRRGKGGCVCIKAGERTMRPYITTYNLREIITNEIDSLPKTQSGIVYFVKKVREWNDSLCDSEEISELDAGLYLKCKKIRFMLGFDRKMRWIREIARSL
jgi:hypothetical protein